MNALLSYHSDDDDDEDAPTPSSSAHHGSALASSSRVTLDAAPAAEQHRASAHNEPSPSPAEAHGDSAQPPLVTSKRPLDDEGQTSSSPPPPRRRARSSSIDPPVSSASAATTTTLPPLPSTHPLHPLLAPSPSLQPITLPQPPPSDALTAKLAHFHALKDQGTHFNTSLSSNRAFHNPHIYDKLVAFLGVDQRGTNLPSSYTGGMLRCGEAKHRNAQMLANIQRTKAEEKAASKRTSIAFTSSSSSSSSSRTASVHRPAAAAAHGDSRRQSDGARGREDRRRPEREPARGARGAGSRR